MRRMGGEECSCLAGTWRPRVRGGAAPTPAGQSPAPGSPANRSSLPWSAPTHSPQGWTIIIINWFLAALRAPPPPNAHRWFAFTPPPPNLLVILFHRRVFYHWITEADRQKFKEAWYVGKILIGGKIRKKSFCDNGLTTRRKTEDRRLLYYKRSAATDWQHDERQRAVHFDI
jgi:hypothetical protein